MEGHKKSRPGKGNGSNSNREFKGREKILVNRSFIGDYAALLEVYYFDAGKQYKTTALTKNLDILENEPEFKTFIGGIVAACKQRRAAL